MIFSEGMENVLDYSPFAFLVIFVHQISQAGLDVAV